MIEKGDWLSDKRLLLYVVDVKDNKYTIQIFMKLALDTLFVATDTPVRKFQWSQDSMGLQGVEKNCNEFIKYIFENKIVFTELNKD